ASAHGSYDSRRGESGWRFDGNRFQCAEQYRKGRARNAPAGAFRREEAGLFPKRPCPESRLAGKPDIENPFFPEVIKSFEVRARSLGYDAILSDTNYDTRRTREAAERMMEHNV